MRNERNEVKRALETILEIAEKGRLEAENTWDQVAEHTRLTETERLRLMDGIAGHRQRGDLHLLIKDLEVPSAAEVAHQDDRDRREAELIAAVPEIKNALKAKGLRLNADQWRDYSADHVVSAKVQKPKHYFHHDHEPYVEITIYGVGCATLGLEVLTPYEIGLSPTIRELEHNPGVAHFTILGRKPA